MTIKKGDLVAGAVLAGLGSYIVVQARQWEYLGADGPGPGFFPLWYGLAIIGLALVLMATSVARPATPTPRADSAGTDDGRAGQMSRALATWAGLAACIGLLEILGFLLAFALFTFFVAAVMYRRPVLPALAVAVAGAISFYLLFPLALSVELPKGLLGF